MKDSNIKKMSERALPQLTDVPSINILICNLLYRLKRDVTKQQLYDILVGSEIVSYFFYEDSIDYLVNTGSVKLENKDEDNKNPQNYFVELTKQGEICATKLKNYVSKLYRDRAEIKAMIYFSNLKLKNQIDIEYIKIESGYFVQIICKDKPDNLMELKFKVSSLEQAKFLAQKVQQNPNEFYRNIFESFDTEKLEENFTVSND